ncbi:MAG: hypothetical protein U5L09_03745 [Bacteroidales bacterium]|nr:hypothetical protein [Bacteroidales bacterium]
MKTSYTLQFAEGTGSNTETAKALILSGQPNLRSAASEYRPPARYQHHVILPFWGRQKL